MTNEEPKMSSSSTNGGGFKGAVDKFLFSGEKKHVMAGLGIITLVFGVPWFLMNRGTKHQSHQDYLEKADKARQDRLSPSSASAK